MSTYRLLSVLAATLGLLVWIFWIPAPAERKHLTPAELYAATTTVAGVEKIFQSFER